MKIQYNIDAHPGSDSLQIVLGKHEDKWTVPENDVSAFVKHLVSNTEIFDCCAGVDIQVNSMFSSNAATGVTNTVSVMHDRIVTIQLVRRSGVNAADIEVYAKFLADALHKFITKMENFFPQLSITGATSCED